MEDRRPADARGAQHSLLCFHRGRRGLRRKVKSWIAGRSRDVVVVCAKGDSSEFVAEILRPHGIESRNLSGGMVQWGRDEIFRPIPAPLPPDLAGQPVWKGMPVLHDRPWTGCGDRGPASPDRRLSRLRFAPGTRLAGSFRHSSPSGPRLRCSQPLARGEDSLLGNPADFTGAGFDFMPLHGGAGLRIEGIELMPVDVLHSPGHTPGSTCLLVNRAYLLTGDTLFVSGVGAPGSGWTCPGVGARLIQDDSRPAPRCGR